MTPFSTIRVDYNENPAVLDAYSGKKPGDKCEFEVQATILSMDTDGVTFTVEAVIPEGYELDESADTTQMEQGSQGMMTPASMLVRKKKSTEESGYTK